MKIKELLLEYDRNITAKKFGSKLLYQWANGPDSRDYNEYYKNISDSAKELKTVEERKKYIEEESIKYLLYMFESADPTPSKKYVSWLVREYVQEHIRKLEDLPRFGQYLELYDRVKNSPNFKQYVERKTEELFLRTGFRPDITYEKFKNIFNLSSIDFTLYMSDYKKPEPKLVNKGTSNTVYEDETVRVIQPLDEQAACYYGQGTEWCTAFTKAHNRFETYNTQGPLYILIGKGRDKERFQLHIESEQFMDENDNPVNLDYLLYEFAGFTKWLSTKAPNKDMFQQLDLYILQDNNVKQKIWQMLANIFEILVNNYLADLESDDGNYLDWLASQAYDSDDKSKYTDEQGEIDWDKFHEIAGHEVNYEEYNPIARTYRIVVQEMKNMSSTEIANELNEFMERSSWSFEKDLENGWGSFTEVMKEGFINIVNKELISKEAVLTRRTGRSYKFEHDEPVVKMEHDVELASRAYQEDYIKYITNTDPNIGKYKIYGQAGLYVVLVKKNFY